jgi:hypothetical protein
MEVIMRWFWILLLIVSVIGLLTFFRFDTVSVDKIDAQKAAFLDKSSVSIVYELSEKSWITFSTGDSQLIKIVSNATIAGALPFFDVINYALEYQILDSNEKILDKKIYNFRGGVSTFIKKINGEDFVYSNSFYLEKDLMPTDGNVFILNLSALKDAQKVQLRLVSKSDAVQSVAVRYYVNRKVSEYKLPYVWDRMNDYAKQVLAIGNVYPVEFLTEEEKRNSLMHSWQPIGPEGILGSDYRTKELYILKNNDGMPHDVLLPPAGVVVDANHEGIIPIPEPGGVIELELTSAEGTLKKDSPIQYHWFGRGIDQRQQGMISHGNVPMQTFVHTFKSGLLQISSKEKLAIRAYLKDQQKKTEITPEPLYLQSFMAVPNMPVEFSVAHQSEENTPFRIDLRRLFPVLENKDTQGYIASFELLDSKNGIVSQGDISGTFVWLRYDRLAGLNQKDMISDPLSQYFYLPPEVVKIRISTKKNPILVVGYNRPSQMVRKVRVPEDSFVFDLADEWQARWFYLKPIKYSELFKESRVKILNVQYRPSVDNLDILQGRYLWEDYHPEGSWLGRILFVPFEGPLPFRQSALPSYFQAVSAGQSLLLHFKTRQGMEMATPTLAWQREEASPMNVRIYVDGKQYYETSVIGKRGETALPPIAEGRYMFRIEASGSAKFFVNYVILEKGGYARSLVNELAKEGLTFVYERTTTAPETLILKYYTPDQNHSRPHILATILPPKAKGIGPWSEWSFLKYEFDIRPDNQGTLPVFGTDSEQVDLGQLLFIPLGGDMPLGRYTFRFESKDGAMGYLSLTKITPGFVEQRKFIQGMNLGNE